MKPARDWRYKELLGVLTPGDAVLVPTWTRANALHHAAAAINARVRCRQLRRGAPEHLVLMPVVRRIVHHEGTKGTKVGRETAG